MAFPWHPGKRKPRQKRYKRRKIGGCLSNRRGDSRIAPTHEINRVHVGRGLAPAVNLHRTPRRGQNSPNSDTLRREQAPALPCKMHFVRRPQKRCNLLQVVEVTAAPLPLCRCATFPLTGESHRPLRSHFSLPVPRPPIYPPQKTAAHFASVPRFCFFLFHATRPSFFAARRTNSSRAAIANKKPNSAPAATSDRKCRPIIIRVKPNSQV